MNENYQKKLDMIIENIEKSNHIPKLLLHSCCAPCSSYCLEYLSKTFDITVLYYNPNISIKDEYDMRTKEQIRLIEELNRRDAKNIKFVEGEYDSSYFFEKVRGYEDCKEGGERCKICFDLRLDYAASYAFSNHFDYFTTTLTISPLKNAALLNEIGEMKAEKYGINFLPSDFKKKNGYKRSIELSKQFNLYRQNYCGCVFSKRDSQKGI